MKDKELKVQINYTQEGRVTIPREVRRMLKLEYTDAFDVTVENGKIVLDPVNKIKCEICGNTKELVEIHDLNTENRYYVCSDCIGQIKNSITIDRGIINEN